MKVADITLAMFTFFNSLRFLAYVPQIARAVKDQSGAEAISFGTWDLFLASHVSAMAYAIENQRDWTMASLFLGNVLGCGAILLIAGWKRSRYRGQESRQSHGAPAFGIDAARTHRRLRSRAADTRRAGPRPCRPRRPHPRSRGYCNYHGVYRRDL